MRPSSLGGGRILRHTLSVCPSVCPSVRPSRYCFCLLFYSRTVLRANIQNRKISVFAYGPASRMYFSARAEGRISYGHLFSAAQILVLLHFGGNWVRDKTETMVGRGMKSRVDACNWAVYSNFYFHN